MSNMFERGILGGTFGGALGTVLAGTVLALPGINIVLAPVAAATAIAATATVSTTAACTLAGATAGAISGAKEDLKNR